MFYKKIMPARIPLRVYSGYILKCNKINFNVETKIAIAINAVLNAKNAILYDTTLQCGNEHCYFNLLYAKKAILYTTTIPT